MISGVVHDREARVRLRVHGPEDRNQELDAVIDTGYTASLSLPPALIISLRLSWQSIGRGVLADGSECLFDVFDAEIDWDGQRIRILADEADTDPLIGMGLLAGFELYMEIQSGGKVSIQRMV